MKSTNDTQSIGAEIRALRKARGQTIETLVSALERSVGWLSQIENGMSEPSIRDLKKIALHFEVPLGFFFQNENSDEKERGLVVRAENRRPLGNTTEGLTEELLSPDLTGNFETVRSVFWPGAETVDYIQRDTQELAFVISGTLDIEIDGVWHRLGSGDSIAINGVPHRWRNPGDIEAITIWTISPPIY